MLRTVKTPVTCRGIGLHSGIMVAVSVRPARPGSGILFRRTDAAPGTGDIPARYDLVTDTRLCTLLTNEHGVSVGTVEHLMAALAGLGLHDALVEVDGPELPILDGSAAPWVQRLVRGGVIESGLPGRAIRILSPVTVSQGDKSASLIPAARFEIAFRIRFEDPAIGEQRCELAMTGAAFVEELADCRTFAQRREIEAVRSLGKARGGSLENAIVVDQGRVLNPGGLRRPDEFVRHKMLDAVGDLALAGAPILGRYIGDKAGHEMTNLLLRALFDRPQAWEWARPRAALLLGPGAAARVPLLAPEDQRIAV